MEKQGFIEYLTKNAENFEWAEGEHDKKPGIYVKNKEYDTETHFSEDAIKNHDLDVLVTQTYQGKNVEQITRVTGFFSKVQSWNKGKRGELKDRNRVNDVDK
jgi:anaerobic ribonucleoside-triphosphate reductase